LNGRRKGPLNSCFFSSDDVDSKLQLSLPGFIACFEVSTTRQRYANSRYRPLDRRKALGTEGPLGAGPFQSAGDSCCRSRTKIRETVVDFFLSTIEQWVDEGALWDVINCPDNLNNGTRTIRGIATILEMWFFSVCETILKL